MIKIEHEGHRLEVTTDRNYTLPEMIDVLFKVALFGMNETVKQVPSAKAQVYDMVNYKATALLENFAPEYEMRSDLSVEAVVKAENELIEDELSKMQGGA